MLYVPRAHLSGAYISQSGRQLHPGQCRLDIGLNADAVLYQQHERALSEQRREHGGQTAVGRGLQGHDDHVARGHAGNRGISLRMAYDKRTVVRIYPQTVIPNILKITVQKEMHVEAGPCQPPAIEPAYGPCTNDGISHICIIVFDSSQRYAFYC